MLYLYRTFLRYSKDTFSPHNHRNRKRQLIHKPYRLNHCFHNFCQLQLDRLTYYTCRFNKSNPHHRGQPKEAQRSRHLHMRFCICLWILLRLHRTIHSRISQSRRSLIQRRAHKYHHCKLGWSLIYRRIQFDLDKQFRILFLCCTSLCYR